MTTVALIGADGAGKTTVARCMQDGGRVPVRYLYLGVYAEASNHLLPTTRLSRWVKRRQGRVEDHGPPPAVEALTATAQARRPPLKALKSWAKLANRVADEWYRQGVAAWLERRGHIVVFDRHYLADFAAHDMDRGARLPPERRLHGWLLRRFYPEPDLVVFLDAPAETLLSRKGEGSHEDLQRRRADYLALAGRVRRFVVVDAAQPLADVVEAVERELRAAATTAGAAGAAAVGASASVAP
jgi:thymidylate kinase